MASYQLNGIYSFGQPRHGPATMSYLPPYDPSVYNKDYLKPSSFLNEHTPYAKNAHGIQLPPDDTDKFGWAAASTHETGKTNVSQFNKNYLKIPGRQDITVPAPKPNSKKDRLSVFKKPADDELTPAGSAPADQGAAFVNNMSPVELAKMLKKTAVDQTEHEKYAQLVKFFTSFELLMAKGPLTSEQQKEYDDTFEYVKKEAIDKLQNTGDPLNPYNEEIKDEQKLLDASRAAIPVAPFKPIGAPPAGAADPAVLADLAADRAVNAAASAQAAAVAAVLQSEVRDAELKR